MSRQVIDKERNITTFYNDDGTVQVRVPYFVRPDPDDLFSIDEDDEGYDPVE